MVSSMTGTITILTSICISTHDHQPVCHIVEDRGMTRAIVIGHEQQNSMKAPQQIQASTHYHVSKVLPKTARALTQT